MREWGSESEWAPSLAALAWRGTREVLDAVRDLTEDEDANARSASAYVLGQLGMPERSMPDKSAAVLEEMADRETNPEVLEAIAGAFANLGEPYGLETLLRLRRHPDAIVRDGAAGALAGRDDERVDHALIELTNDSNPAIRDWATFALGTLSPRDTDELRDALAARLGDEDDDTRIEAIHGLALRGDERGSEAALALLVAGEPEGEEERPAETIWKRHALQQATIRLAALTGDPRFRAHLPELDERWRGTALEGELTQAHARTAGD